MTRKKFTDELEAAIEHGIDVPGRRIFLHGDVDEGSIGKAIRGLYLLADLEQKPIELFVTSYGGEIDESFAMHDVCRTIKVPVHTVALGKCMSAAPIIVAAGEHGHRYASENALFMMHDCTMDEVEGSPSQIAVSIKAAAEQMDLMAEMLGKYTQKPKRHWQTIFKSKTDRYFNAETALAWGLIDTIWSEK